MKNKKTKCKWCDVPLEEHVCYLARCSGCPNGHSSFWRTIVQSPQWKEWRKYAWEGKKQLYDFPEVEEGGVCSQEHFQDFIKFIIKNNEQSKKKKSVMGTATKKD